MGTMQSPSVARLGHVGLYCTDAERMRDFYVEILGFTVTDADPERHLYFLSADPAYDHHMLVLVDGRTAPSEVKLVQQVSWRCETLQDVLNLHQRLRAAATRFDRIVSHGNAIGVYFLDPDGNRTEVYWPTGLDAQQPFSQVIDLDGSPEAVFEQAREGVALRHAGQAR